MMRSSTSQKAHNYRRFCLLVRSSKRLGGVVCDQCGGCANAGIPGCWNFWLWEEMVSCTQWCLVTVPWWMLRKALSHHNKGGPLGHSLWTITGTLPRLSTYSWDTSCKQWAHVQ